MTIKEITSKEIWEEFLLSCKEKTFLNSWNWGEFQDKQEDKIWRFGIYEEEKLAGIALVVKVKARRGTFLFIPHTPNVKSKNKEEALKTLVDKLREMAKQERASFIRVAPIWERSEENKKVFEGLGFKEAPIHMHPEVTWELDISSSEEELLSKMRKTTRYLIKQAEKNQDIEVIKSFNLSDLETFHNILKETAGRHGFVPFSLNYLIEQFSCFNPDDQIVVWLGKYKEEVVSSAVMVYWQGTGFYHHGASLQKHNSNKAPVSYLLQWEAIKEAKRRGCGTYNFWGIAPEIKTKEDAEKSKHPWAGLSLFKMGFGGQRKEYVKTQDLPLSFLYYPTLIFENLRKIRRRV